MRRLEKTVFWFATAVELEAATFVFSDLLAYVHREREGLVLKPNSLAVRPQLARAQVNLKPIKTEPAGRLTVGGQV